MVSFLFEIIFLVFACGSFSEKEINPRINFCHPRSHFNFLTLKRSHSNLYLLWCALTSHTCSIHIQVILVLIALFAILPKGVFSSDMFIQFHLVSPATLYTFYLLSLSPTVVSLLYCLFPLIVFLYSLFLGALLRLPIRNELNALQGDPFRVPFTTSYSLAVFKNDPK